MCQWKTLRDPAGRCPPAERLPRGDKAGLAGREALAAARQVLLPCPSRAEPPWELFSLAKDALGARGLRQSSARPPGWAGGPSCSLETGWVRSKNRPLLMRSFIPVHNILPREAMLVSTPCTKQLITELKLLVMNPPKEFFGAARCSCWSRGPGRAERLCGSRFALMRPTSKSSKPLLLRCAFLSRPYLKVLT